MIFDAEQVIQRELDSNEKLIWAGMPKQGILFRSSDFFMIPFSVLWGGFAIIWVVTAFLAVSKEDVGRVAYLFPAFGLPFVLIGLYMIFGRFFYDSIKRSKTFYGLTSERIIILSGNTQKVVKSLNLSVVSEIKLAHKKNNYGTISFPGMGRVKAPTFELIENAQSVYSKVRQQHERVTEASSNRN